jgi:hypothetical protein
MGRYGTRHSNAARGQQSGYQTGFQTILPKCFGEIQIIWTSHAATLERLLGNGWSVSKQSIALIGNEAVLDGR